MKRFKRNLQLAVQELYIFLSFVFSMLAVICIDGDVKVPTWICVGFIITTSLTIGKLIYTDLKKGE